MNDIVLTRHASSEPAQRQHGWPLKVVAVSTLAGLPSEIFKYHAALNDDPLVGDIFEAICSLSDLDDVGLTPYTSGDKVVPFYRSATLEFICRSAEEAETLWLNVIEDVQDLVANFKAAAVLTPVGSETIT